MITLTDLYLYYTDTISLDAYQAKDFNIKYPSSVTNGSRVLIKTIDVAYTQKIAITAFITNSDSVTIGLVNTSNIVQTVTTSDTSKFTLCVKISYY